MNRNRIIKLTVSALFLAINIVLSSSIFSVAVPGGHVYLNDVLIVLACVLLDPLEATIVSGLGAFLGDLFFYPAPMFVSLVVRALQGFLISVIAHRTMKERPFAASVWGAVIGAIIMIVGYSLGRAYIYSTPEYAILKLPYQILQALAGVVLGEILCWATGIRKLYNKTVNNMTY
ncbi:MAG: ECF transporter S component [Clostridia bacterium]|nr:ECF transporter S component [Clostridia bacterium]